MAIFHHNKIFKYTHYETRDPDPIPQHRIKGIVSGWGGCGPVLISITAVLMSFLLAALLAITLLILGNLPARPPAQPAI